MAWKTPLLIRREPFNGPFRSFETCGPCTNTVMRMTSMLINANVLAFASWDSLLEQENQKKNMNAIGLEGKVCVPLQYLYTD
jgi:hypothetical protein